LPGHRSWVSSVAFSPDGTRVVTGSFDHTADLWDVASGRELHELIGHTDNVTSVAFSADGRWVLTGSNDSTARLWGTESGKTLWTTPIPFFHPDTWNSWDLAVFAALVVVLGFIPTLRQFQDRYLYLRRPNRFIWVYDLPGIEYWAPIGDSKRRR
jgi:WD40 repeat protein